MVLAITLTESARNKIGIVCAGLCIGLSFLGLCLIAVGIYIQVRINDQLMLLQDYNDGLLPNFLISVGTLMMILNGVTAKFAYDSGFAETSDKFRLALVPVLVVMFLLSWVILAASLTTYAHRGSVEEALMNGILGAMKRYKNNVNVKSAIDRIQMKSRCCGSRTFKDWFSVGWINPEFVDTSKFAAAMKDGNIFVENVPFSCCDVTSLRPCITTDVMNFLSRKNYDKVTLYKMGCSTKLMDEFENEILQPVGTFVLALYFTQVVLMLLLRYLQTSVQDAMDEGDAEGPGKGYVIPNICEACTTGDPNKYVKQGALDRMRGIRTKSEDDADETVDDTVIDMDETGDTTGGQFGDDREPADFGGGTGGGGGGPEGGDGAGAEGGEVGGKDKKDKKDKKGGKDKKGEKDKKGGKDKKSGKDKKGKKGSKKQKQKKKPAKKSQKKPKPKKSKKGSSKKGKGGKKR